MIRPVIRLLNTISRGLNFDILWRIINRLPRRDRAVLTWRLMTHFGIEDITFRRGHTRWTCHGWDGSIMLPLLKTGEFQGAEVNAVLSWMKQCGRITSDRKFIVDVGANIGTTCVPFAQNTDCRIAAIEPVPGNFRVLRRNVQDNGLVDRIVCIQKAVCLERGSVEMMVPVAEAGGAFIRQAHASKDVEAREIVSVSSDGLMNILGAEGISPEQIAFVWSDTEGSEANVIQTGQALWNAGVPLYIELYPAALQRQGGLERLKDMVPLHFDRYIISKNIVERGTAAKEHWTSEFPTVIERVLKGDGIADVLLLPPMCESRSASGR